MTRGRVLFISAVAALLLTPSFVSAHGLLHRASPAEGSVLNRAPREIHLTFTEEPERVFTRIALVGPGGRAVALDSVVVMPGHAAAAGIRGPITPGVYVVRWQTAGRDGHVVAGSYEFTVAPGAAGSVAKADAAASSEPTGPLRGTAIGSRDEVGRIGTPAVIAAILRWLTLAAVVTAIGTVTFRATVLRRIAGEMDPEISALYMPRALRGSALLGVVASGIFVVVAIARLVTQSYTLHGIDAALDSHVLHAMVFGSSWGSSWLLQILVGAFALTVFTGIYIGFARLWLVAGFAAVGLAISLALAGHAVVMPRYAAAIVTAHVIHTVAASGWLGSLFAIALVGLPLASRLDREDRWTVVADTIRAFSPAALLFAGIAVLAGTFIAWTHLGSVTALFTTDYGRVLIAKLAFLTATLATGAYNWRRVRPALGDELSAGRLRRSSTAELVIAALVLVATAILVATPPPVS